MKTKAFSLVFGILLFSAWWSVSHAIVTTNITASPLPPCPAPCGAGITTVTPINGTEYRITGGARPGGNAGTNLFHSFGSFTLGAPDTANFFNDTGLATSNILSRVTGTNNPSYIFGTIQTTGFGNANLFLINPAGVVFGPNATLDIGRSIGTPGSFHVSTADYIRFNDPSQLDVNKPRFYADPTQSSILTSFSPDAFGFLNPNPAAITVDGSILQVGLGQTISLVGGNRTFTREDTGEMVPGGVTVTGGQLSAPSGHINLVSVASPGEVLFPSLQNGPNVNGDVFTSMGTINLSQGASLDASGDAAGTVVIRGGQLVVADATISADTGNTKGAPIAIDINVTGDMSISSDTVPALMAKTTGSGDAGEIRISSANLTATSSTFDILTMIDSHTSGTGKAGNVSITTGNLQVTGSFNGFSTFIDSGTEGPGRAGDVSITARNFQMDNNSFISTGNFLASLFGVDASGSGGNITISADSLRLAFSEIVTDARQAGNITVTANVVNLEGSPLSSAGQDRGGAITINTNQLTTTDSQIVAQTRLGPGGAVTITGKVIELSTGSSVVSSTDGDGDAGPIIISATDHLGLLRATQSDRPSGIFSNSFGTFGSSGNAGDIVITTPKLEMTGGARINTTTATSGHGGNVTINKTDSVSMSGETGSFAPEPLFSLGTIQPSGIFTLTIGGHCSGPCGNAGNVSLSTGALTMGSGAQINSGTSSTGRGGDITIRATGQVSISGTLTDGSPAGVFSRTIGTAPGSGGGGNIELHGTQVAVMNGASISASSTGTGNAGTITVNASDSLVMQNSSITTQTIQSDGGDIHIQTGRMVQLNDSQITTSVQGGTGNGGNITIDPQFVILQNSQVLAQAFGGNGGNIRIVAGVFFADPNSRVDASSTRGIDGTVDIQTPVTSLSGTLAPLPAEIVQAAALLQARCAARLAGGTSGSFVVAGRDGLPLEPGALLPSPLYVERPGSTRLVGALDIPKLRVGRTFVDSNLTLAPLATGCSS